MEGYRDQSTNQKLFYQFYSGKKNSMGLLVVSLLLGAVVFAAYLEGWDWYRGVEHFYVLLVVIAMMFVLIVHQRVRGIRSLSIEGETISLVYPSETIQFALRPEQLRSVRTRKKKGRTYGIVFLIDNDERKHYLRTKFHEPGGKEVYEWFLKKNI
jgi:hypothetical protein